MNILQIVGENEDLKWAFQIDCTQFTHVLGLLGQYLLIYTTLANLANKLRNIWIKHLKKYVYWRVLCCHRDINNFFIALHWNFGKVSNLVVSTKLINLDCCLMQCAISIFRFPSLHLYLFSSYRKHSCQTSVAAFQTWQGGQLGSIQEKWKGFWVAD